MKWIGLTGGIATGKSTVAQLLREAGLAVVDADQIVHHLLSTKGPTAEQVVAHFGSSILGEQGHIERKKLGALVFSGPRLLRELESLILPEVRRRVAAERQKLERAGTKLAIYDVPLLFEKHMEQEFDAIICVASSAKLQRERLRRRNGLSDTEIDQRLAAQLPLSSKMARSNFVLTNDGDLSQLSKEINDKLIPFILA